MSPAALLLCIALHAGTAVLSCDTFERMTLNTGEKYIINLAKSTEANGHFVVICVKNDCFTYFDPYRLSCYNPFILSAFQQKPEFQVKYLNKDIQGSKISFFCGFFCICYLICDEIGLSDMQFISLFDESRTINNEGVCIHIIKLYLSSM